MHQCTHSLMRRMQHTLSIMLVSIDGFDVLSCLP
jgi:hypothetical protein